MRPIILFFLPLTLLLSTACSHGPRPDWVGDSPLPRSGEALPAGLLQAARDFAAANPGQPVVHNERTSWILPSVSRKYRLEYNPETDQLAASDYSMVGLGIPYAYQPLQFSFSRYVYTEDGSIPVQELRRRYWPWWSNVSTRGEEIDPTLRADLWGIPLLYESGSESGPVWYFDDANDDFESRMTFSFWTALWWIGPVWFDTETTRTKSDGIELAERGKYFFPLFLGRAPGALLWMSGHTETEIEEGGIQTITAHGPLLGYALYHSLENESINRSRTLLLGGALWYDNRASSESRRIIGPLWGFFGLSRW